MRDVRRPSQAEVAEIARWLCGSTDPAGALGQRGAARLLRAALRQRRSVVLVSGPPGRVAGVCVISTAPRALLRAALVARGPGSAPRVPLPPVTQGGAAVVVLSAEAAAIDGLITASLAELDDHDVHDVAIIAAERQRALLRCGFTPGPMVGAMPTMRWT